MNAVQADDLPELHSIVTGLRRDFDAARAGLTMDYGSGPVKGHVNRIGMLKSPSCYFKSLRSPRRA